MFPSRGNQQAAGMMILLTLLLGLFLPQAVNARAILGVDLGSLYMKVALVQSGSPIEIVTNLHSKRKTEQMILFDKGNQRFYGADAAALLARKAHTTPVAMSLMLGRDERHPVVQVLAERHYPLLPKYNASRSGLTLTVDGVAFTPEELVAMVLSHAVDISVAYAVEGGNTILPPRDMVLTVPSYATMPERQALLDAAALADLNVLTLMDENTAAALHYAMDKNFEQEQLLLFYNMGASALQISVIRFFNYMQPQKYGAAKSVPALEVLGKSWDATCGGDALDHILVEYLADQFNVAWHAAFPQKKDDDVRKHARAMTKLRLQANKIKHVLSANAEIPVHMDAVHDEVSLQTHISRAQLEQLAEPLMQRSIRPIAAALAVANKTMADLTGIELIGGGMRIPKIQQEIQKLLPEGMELGMHINSDESFALGAAFAGANLSTAFRVRPVGLTDISPFAMAVSLTNLDEKVAAEWSKTATLFKSFGKVGVKKTIAFTHDQNILCGLDYLADDPLLPTGTELSLVRYNITGIPEFALEMQNISSAKPKISLQFELSPSGIASLVKAEAAVEEIYTVQEEVEVDESTATANATNETNATSLNNVTVDDTSSNSSDANATVGKNATEKVVKPKVLVEKEKKRIHKKPLSVKTYYVGAIQPHSEELMAESRHKLYELAQRDKERMMLEEAKNKVESYIYKMKNKLSDDEETMAKFSTEAEREKIQTLSAAAEDWLYDDGATANQTTLEAKYEELSDSLEPILLRIEESVARPKALNELNKKLTDAEALLVQWETSKPQITEEERQSVTTLIERVRQWIDEQEAAQAQRQLSEEPAYLSREIPDQFRPIEALVLRLSRKPKPKPVVTNTTNTTESNFTASATNETVVHEASNETDTTGSSSAAANETSSSKEEIPVGVEDEL